jgi:TAT (twin-arginine translocation) pathway signal sequence
LPISRRGFLKILLVATGGAAVAALVLRGSLRGLSHQLANPTLAKTAIGPLSGHTVTTLLATTEAFLGSPIEKAHYEDFFRWESQVTATPLRGRGREVL